MTVALTKTALENTPSILHPTPSPLENPEPWIVIKVPILINDRIKLLCLVKVVYLLRQDR